MHVQALLDRTAKQTYLIVAAYRARDTLGSHVTMALVIQTNTKQWTGRIAALQIILFSACATGFPRALQNQSLYMLMMFVRRYPFTYCV
jgi:hypothetical protein